MYEVKDKLDNLMSENGIAAEIIRGIYESAPSLPPFPDLQMNWQMPSVSISDWIYEDATNPESLMQPWVVLLAQMTAAAAAYKMIPAVGRAAKHILTKSQDIVLNASGYDTSIDLNAPKPKAGYLKAMLVGGAKVAASCSRYIAEKSVHISGTLLAVVNTPRILNSEQMQMIRNVGFNPWLQRDLPSLATFANTLRNLSWTDISNGWQTFNTEGVNYTSQGIGFVTEICSSVYAEPVSWAQWGVERSAGLISNCLGTAWQIVQPTVTSSLDSLHGCTRDAVSTCTYGLLSGQGLEPYFELGTLALVAGLYWGYGRVTVNNTNTVTGNHVTIHTGQDASVAVRPATH
ncbi:MAG: hypothetical protein U1E78_07295 [Gammaproteobacteria bacterium]